MIVKLRTSKKTQDIFACMKSKENLEPFILSKIAIALSIKKGPLGLVIQKTDNEGLELNRQTIFGEYDLIFKALITNCEGRPIDEDEYFPRMVKAHLDRGAELLANEKRYTKDFYNYMCRLNDGI